MTLLNVRSSARPAAPAARWSIGSERRVARKGGATAGELCQYAAEAFQTYAETLLRALMAAASRRESGDVEAWVRRQFHAGMENAGMPLREAVAESPHRHAVAQGLTAEDVRGRADAPPGTQGTFPGGPARRHQAGATP